MQDRPAPIPSSAVGSTKTVAQLDGASSDYARAIISQWSPSAVDVHARVAARMARQTVLTRETLSYRAILDESVLRRQIGGSVVFADQLRHLVRMSERDNVQIQVIRTSAEPHRALVGSFIAIEFSDDTPLVQVEHLASLVIIDDVAEVRAHIDALSTLAEKAMSPALSAGLIDQFAAEVDQ